MGRKRRDRKEALPFRTLNQIVLTNTPFAARRYLGAHAAHHLSVTTDYEPVSRELVVDLRTLMLRENLGEETKVVRVQAAVPLVRGAFYYVTTLASAALIAVGCIVLVLGDPIFACSFFAWAWGLMMLAATTWPREVHVNREVEIVGLYWHKFPDANKVYPAELGSPVIDVDVGEPKLRPIDA